jgi:hypothetical protein
MEDEGVISDEAKVSMADEMDRWFEHIVRERNEKCTLVLA